MSVSPKDVTAPTGDSSSASCATSVQRAALKVISHGCTDKGRVRSVNEDQFLIAILTKALQVVQSSLSQEEMHYGAPQGHLFLVADGVGGNAAGEKASALAVSAIEDFVLR